MPLRSTAPVHYSLLGLCALALVACSDGSDSFPDGVFRLPGCADSSSCASNPPLMIGGDRPAAVAIPADYNVNQRYPLIVLLHGRGVDGWIQATYMDQFTRVDRLQYVLVYPDGERIRDGRRQWCSDALGCELADDPDTLIDDVAYISSLIEEAAATYSIDVSRVGLIGHSSGGFMSFTMACEAPHLVTSIVNLAGGTRLEAASCQEGSAVSVLTIHGTADDTVPYAIALPSAEFAVALAGCDAGDPQTKPDFNLLPNIEGDETSVTYWPDCRENTDVEFWSMEEGPHIPTGWSLDGLDRMVNWAFEHPRN